MVLLKSYGKFQTKISPKTRAFQFKILYTKRMSKKFVLLNQYEMRQNFANEKRAKRIEEAEGYRKVDRRMGSGVRHI